MTDDGTSTALVLRDRAALVQDAVATDYPRLRTMRRRSLTGTGRSDGFASGTRADLGAHRLGGRRALPR